MFDFFGLSAPLKEMKGGCVTIGMFDGVHLGHQKVLRETVAWAQERGCPSAVITFDRHPEEIVAGAAPPLLTSFKQKLRLIARAGIDGAIMLRFDDNLADMDPDEFVAQILVRRLEAKAVLLGFDCRFGKKGQGDFALLERLAATHGFEARRSSPLAFDGQTVSSTVLRALLAQGDLDRAARLLGRKYALEGTVIHGKGLGQKYGFPTANLDTAGQLIPSAGVYVALAEIDNRRHSAVVNVGFAPGASESNYPAAPDVECHLLDFSDDLYGKTLEVIFLAQLRPEKKFASAADAVQNITADVAAARRFHESTQSGTRGTTSFLKCCGL